MNLLNVLNALVAITTITQQVLPVVEEASSASGNGAAKKALALSLIRSVYDATNPVVPFDTLATQVGNIIDAVVSFYNTIGKFVKSVKLAA